MKKKLIAALVFVGLSANTFAIDNEPEEGFSAQVYLGFTASNIKNYSDELKSIGFNDFSLKPGGTVGFKLEYMLPNAHGTYINTGLDWIMKGTMTTEKNNLINDKEATLRVCPHYLEVPIHVGFHYNISDEIGFYGDFGPYFAIGVGGKNKVNIKADGLWTAEYEREYPIFKKDNSRNYFQRWDAGLGFRIGCEYNQHYSLNLGCDWGITDMWRNEYRDMKFENHKPLNSIHNFAMNISFGYRF